MKLLRLGTRPKLPIPAGIISLLILPVLCIAYLKQHHAFDKYGVVDVAFYNPVSMKMFAKPRLPNKRFAVINITSNNLKNEINLNYVRQLIRKYKIQKDAVRAIQIHFENKSQYWTFIKAIDICKAENIEFFTPYKDDIYIYPYQIVTNSITTPTFICGTGEATYNSLLNQRKDEERKRFMQQSLKDFSLPIVVIIIMLAFSLRSIHVFHNLSSKRTVFGFD